MAFLDDDAIPDKLWLNKLLKGFNSHEVAGVGGDVFDSTGISYQARRIISNRFGDSDNNYTMNSPVAIPHVFKFISVIGVNSIYRRDIILSIGGYDEQYDYFLDETDLCARIIDAGYYINYQKGADVYHKKAHSDLRDERQIILDYSTIVKNLIYYCYQYKYMLGEEVIKAKVREFIKVKKRQVEHKYKDNVISQKEYIAILQSIERGEKDGEESVKRGYKLLISQETLEKYKADFKKFPNFFNDDFSKKKTIVLLTHEYYPNIQGGIASLVHNMGINLSKRGHNVHIITSDEHKYDYPSVTFENNIWIHRIKAKKYEASFLRANTHYDIDIKETNILMLSKLYTIYEEILSISKKYKVDIVHNFCWENLSFYALQDDNLNCVTTLVTPARYVFVDSENIEHKEMIELERLCLENNKNIIGDSKYIVDFCVNYYNNVKNAKVIYLGMEDRSKEEINDVIKEDNKIEILFLGRLEKRKGIDLLFNIIPDLCEQYDNVIFRIVGNNIINIPRSRHTYLENFLKTPNNRKLVSSGRVVIEGVVEDTAPFYKNCDIFVAPSRFESFGLIYLEAMMFSKPIVGTKASAIPEVVEENVTGLLAEPESEQSLKNCLIKLIEDQFLRKSMGIKGRKRYEKLFTSDTMIDNMLNFYEQVIKK